MALAIYTKKGVNYPAITCDACGKPIKDANQGMIVFPELSGNPFLQAVGIYHKVCCDPGNQTAHCWDVLSNYLRQFVCNMKLGKIIINGNERQLVIDLPEPDGFMEIIGKPDW